MNKVIFFSDIGKLHDAFNYFDIRGFSGKKVPVKLHMGEIKNRYFMRPEFVAEVVAELKQVNAEPFLLDTTVAYPGLRRSKTGYEKLAKIHGFTLKKVGCKVVIDTTGVPVKVENQVFDVATHLVQASHIVCLTHVKGHIQAGMGGALKNFGMGGVTRETKIRIHDASMPVYSKDACTLCGVCAEMCPFHAIQIKGGRLKHNTRACFGCGVCVDVCTSNSFRFIGADLQYLLACATKACVHQKKVIYINELKRIARSCDCDPIAGPLIAPDIGFLMSDDPVAIDAASLDKIHAVKPDVFKKTNTSDPWKQIRFAEQLSIGSTTYSLVTL